MLLQLMPSVCGQAQVVGEGWGLAISRERRKPEGAPQCFNFGSHQIRVVVHGGEPWFMGSDVCKALGLRLYPSQYTQRLSSDEKQVLYLSHVLNTRLSQLFDNKVPSVTLISESGLYKLVMRSDKPEAKRFQDWVTREVLPTIRKRGSYAKQTVDAPQTVSGLSDDAIISRADTANPESEP